MSDLTIGFIGLGAMGAGMCANAVRKHAAAVHVFDLDAGAMAVQIANGAVAATDVATLAASAQVIFLSLPGGKQVRAVCGVIADYAAPGTTVIDLSTTSVADARDVASMFAARSMAFADAPVARARQAAVDGTLSIMVGASQEVFDRIRPFLQYLGSDITHCGEVGCGQVVKLINNTLLFEQVAAIAEMMVVAERAGVTGEKLVEAVGLGSGNSFALQNHAKNALIPRHFPERAFPSDYAIKDLAYTIELAEQMDVEPRMARLANQYYQSAVDRGIGAKYFPAIIELVEGKA
ncbi:MAG: NAD(P)-dependent oxidoreductase [Novosphingobium sp.]|nr:NAD(P)-dependent oxidoreductase [Novosphingobium sp.]